MSQKFNVGDILEWYNSEKLYKAIVTSTSTIYFTVNVISPIELSELTYEYAEDKEYNGWVLSEPYDPVKAILTKVKDMWERQPYWRQYHE